MKLLTQAIAFIAFTALAVHALIQAGDSLRRKLPRSTVLWLALAITLASFAFMAIAAHSFALRAIRHH